MLSATEVLRSAAAQSAVRAGDAGTVVRLVRAAAGMTQTELGAAIGYSQPMLSKFEKGERRITDLAVLRKIADLLGIPPGALGVSNLGPVDRREFVGGVARLAAALALPTHDRPAVTSAHVRTCRATLSKLYEQDQARGAGHVYRDATKLIKDIKALLDSGTYTPLVGRELREVLAAATENAGWLAFDQRRHDRARHWWLEARHLADLDDLTGVRTTVLASMALQAADLRRGAEAVQCAQVAARTPGLSPRVLSLLSARAGMGFAASGDGSQSRRAFATAETLLARGASDDDPPWIGFWGVADLETHRAKAATWLGDHATAETAARTGMAAQDADRWARNRVLYQIRLGETLTRRRAWDEAIHHLEPAVAAVNSISSGRVHENLTNAVRLIGTQQDYQPARAFTVWANRMLGAA